MNEKGDKGIILLAGAVGVGIIFYVMTKKPASRWKIGDTLYCIPLPYGAPYNVPFLVLIVDTLWDKTTKLWLYKLKDLQTGTIWPSYYPEIWILTWGAVLVHI